MWSCPKSRENTSTSRPELQSYTNGPRTAPAVSLSLTRNTWIRYTELIENKSSAAWKQNIRRVNLRVNLRLKTFIFFPENAVNFGCINKPLGKHPLNLKNFSRIICAIPLFHFLVRCMDSLYTYVYVYTYTTVNADQIFCPNGM